VLLAGGETPRRTYEILAGEPFRSRVPWSGGHVFWGDERCVPYEDPRSNAGNAKRLLLDQVFLPETQIHPIRCDISPRLAAAAYEKKLREFFACGTPRFDLVFLGLGADGHTASLLPKTAVLTERQRWGAEVFSAGEGLYRVSLTVPVINRAAVIVFLVSGTGKAVVVREVLEGRPDPHQVPAVLIKPDDGELFWLLDRAAARLLTHAPGRE
jgi:6-phosphogluconolactonase